MRRLISVVLLAAVIGIGSQTAFADIAETPGIINPPPPSATACNTTGVSQDETGGAVETPGLVEFIDVIINTLP